MTITEVVYEARYGVREKDKAFRRKAWTHGDWITVVGTSKSYGGGELFWRESYTTRVSLFYFDDLTATDWHFEGEEP